MVVNGQAKRSSGAVFTFHCHCWRIYYRQRDWSFNKLLKTTETVCVEGGVFVCIDILLLQEHVHCSAAKTLCWFEPLKNGRKLRFSEAKSATAGFKTLLVVSLKTWQWNAWFLVLNMCLKTFVGQPHIMQIVSLGREGWLGSGLRSHTRWWAQCENPEPGQRMLHLHPHKWPLLI